MKWKRISLYLSGEWITFNIKYGFIHSIIEIIRTTEFKLVSIQIDSTPLFRCILQTTCIYIYSPVWWQEKSKDKISKVIFKYFLLHSPYL